MLIHDTLLLYKREVSILLNTANWTYFHATCSCTTSKKDVAAVDAKKCRILVVVVGS